MGLLSWLNTLLGLLEVETINKFLSGRQKDEMFIFG
jgi:hypothetical protein